jgi:hypothetical protein
VATSEDYAAALRRLPEAHALALRLRDAGFADDVICRRLNIDAESLPILFDVARLKLEAVLGKPSPEDRGSR